MRTWSSAAGTIDFRVHKCLLSPVSPIFKTMFTVPQPPTDAPGTLPHVDVTESPETWETIFRTIYPTPTPVIDSIDDLGYLFLAAEKYKTQFVIDSHENGFRDREFIQRDPLRLYAIACACGFEECAKYVARNAENLAVTRRPNADNLEGLTVASYHRLVSFIADRDDQWCRSLSRASISVVYDCGCDRRLREGLVNNIKEALKCPSHQPEEIYLRALEERSRLCLRACGMGFTCLMASTRIKPFIERMVEEREISCDKLMCDKQYVR